MRKAKNHHIFIDLKQETPMWHFQSGQPDCCLRASEVKPKLDRFLNAKALKKCVPLKYKIYFEVDEESRVIINEKDESGRSNFPIYFGNMNEANKHLVFYKNPIRMHLFSLDDQLLNEIKEVLPKFFACHSFGTRQDKGFGCFYPKDENFDYSDASYSFNTTQIRDVDLTEGFKQLFKNIEMFHKMIRSGVNIPNQIYCKSFMFHYAKNKLGEIWDKPVIRHHFCLTHRTYLQKCGKRGNKFVQDEMERLYPILEEARQKQYGGKHYLFRDALGLSGIQKWKAYNDTLAIEGKGLDDNHPVPIKRFKSPILYRPVRKERNNGEVYYTVYIYLYSIPDTYHNAEFIITEKEKTSNNKAALTGMKIHPKFDLKDYLDYVIEFCSENDLMIGDNFGIAKIIANIFKRKKDRNTGEYRLNFRKLT